VEGKRNAYVFQVLGFDTIKKTKKDFKFGLLAEVGEQKLELVFPKDTIVFTH